MGSERGERHTLGGEAVRRIGDDSKVGIRNGGYERGLVEVELKLAGGRGVEAGGGKGDPEVVAGDPLRIVGVRRIGEGDGVAARDGGLCGQAVDGERRAGPVSTSRTRRAGRAAKPRVDANKAQLAAVRVHAVLVVGVREHRLDHEAVARNRDDAASGQDIPSSGEPEFRR